MRCDENKDLGLIPSMRLMVMEMLDRKNNLSVVPRKRLRMMWSRGKNTKHLHTTIRYILAAQGGVSRCIMCLISMHGRYIVCTCTISMIRIHLVNLEKSSNILLS